MSDRRASILRRFLDKVAIVPRDECWHWIGAQQTQGGRRRGGRRTYGHMSGVPELTPSGFAKAHRVAFWLFREPIPPGAELDHVCENRLCVNPWHLEPVDGVTNNARRYGRA